MKKWGNFDHACSLVIHLIHNICS